MKTKVILKPDLTQPTDYLTEDTYIPLLTLGKCYEATFTPLLYDPKTGETFRYYIITCDRLVMIFLSLFSLAGMPI